jgi:hypothetical protein
MGLKIKNSKQIAPSLVANYKKNKDEPLDIKASATSNKEKSI